MIPATLPPRSEHASPCCRVLLVDDNPAFLTSLERFLSIEPRLAVVGRAHSGRTALEEVRRLQPRLVLMDVSMPEMGGLEATQRLKAEPDAPRVIILTMYEDAEFRQAAQDVGADGFVAKSALGTELLPLMQALC